MIAANLPLFALILVIMLGACWALVSFLNRSIIQSKDAEIKLQDRQLGDYREKLQGATPDQARARIDALEAKILAIEPRRLSPGQKAALASGLSWGGGAFRISVVSEGAGDCQQYGADFASVFRSVPGWVVSEPMVMGIGNRPPHGVAVQYPDLNNPPPEAQIIAAALRKAGIVFDIRRGGGRGPEPTVELLICTRIVP